MKELRDKISVSFRFLNINEEHVNNISTVFNLQDRKFRLNKNRAGYVLCVNIDSDKYLEKIIETINSYSINCDEYDVFISIRSEYDTRIYSLPKNAVELIAILKCEVTVSFTYTDPY